MSVEDVARVTTAPPAAADPALVVAIKGGSSTPIPSVTSTTTVPGSFPQTILSAPANVLGASATRRGFALLNDAAADCYVLLGAGAASAALKTVTLVPGAYFEDPFDYQGAVSAVWAAAGAGFLRVTDFQP